MYYKHFIKCINKRDWVDRAFDVHYLTNGRINRRLEILFVDMYWPNSLYRLHFPVG